MKPMKVIWGVLVVGFLMAGVVWGEKTPGVPATVIAPDGVAVTRGVAEQNYVIGPGDILEVSVWRHPDLDTKVTVRPDGNISFPLVGDIRASNMSIVALKNSITSGLKSVIKNPQLTINVSGFDSKKISVLGEVVRPGVYTFDGQLSVLEAISKAGGYARDTAYLPTVIVVRRGPDGKPQGLHINLEDVIEKAKLAENLALQAGDIVFVPRKKVFVLGEVMHPGAYPFDGHMTVLEAISQAGGHDRATAQLSSVILVRRGEGDKVDGRRVNLMDVISKGKKGEDVLLQPGDVIFVPKSFIAKVDQFIDQVFTKTDPVLRYYLDALDVRDQNTSGLVR